MTTHTDLVPGVPWVEIAAGASDWADADPDVLLQLLGRAQWIRSFEEYVLELAGQGLVHGPAHSSVGQEGGAVGSILPLRSDDFVNGSHRGHHQFLAKAVGHVLEPKSGALPALTPEVARGLPPHACRDLRPVRRVLSRARRVDAPAVARGRRDGHQRHRRRGSAAGGRVRVEHEARRHRRRLGHLLRRRSGQHRLGPRVLQPRCSVEAAGLLLHREQPVRRLDAGREGHRRAPALGARAGVQHPPAGVWTAWTPSPSTRR